MTEPDTSKDLDEKLGRLVVPTERYQADLELHSRSIDFSAELVRLALAGIGAVGFVVANVPEVLRGAAATAVGVRLLLAGSVVAFALAVAGGLLHRFLAGGAMFHHLQVIKGLMLGQASERPVADFLSDNLAKRSVLFMRGHRSLAGSAILLAIGAGLVGAAFIMTLLV